MTHPAMIFAAGLGTRMGALTATRPKPLIQVAGKTLLDHALDIARAASPRIVVNTHYLADQISAHLSGQPILISHEPALLETGGGLRAALPLLDGNPVFTLNSDAVWRGTNPLSALAAAWRDDMDALLLLLPRANAIGHTGTGDFTIDGAGRLTRASGLVYSGAQIIRTDDLAAIPETNFSLNPLWDQMAARGTLFGLPYSGQWCDVGQPESLPLAKAMLNG
jgi:MurNAc alpha-1-phosphate uridylyltransferase